MNSIALNPIDKVDFKREYAERKAKLGKWHGEMSVALYSKQEVENALTQFEPLEYRKPIEIASSIELEFHNAGHVLGSAIAELTVQEDGAQRKRYVFSGDLGMKGKVLMPDPEMIDRADVVLIESTYGDRLHRTLSDTEDELVQVISSTMKAQGMLSYPLLRLVARKRSYFC
ncbi:hypothetical protein [Polynucleobacter necessarius]|uniref:hypothetical protein n=1 Tax=Polynucleobacter necessarius TaxID=576610 RepID=UPI0018D52BA6|nr:hypothetical protein [Polynucleobacter necessarius]